MFEKGLKKRHGKGVEMMLQGSQNYPQVAPKIPLKSSPGLPKTPSGARLAQRRQQVTKRSPQSDNLGSFGCSLGAIWFQFSSILDCQRRRSLTIQIGRRPWGSSRGCLALPFCSFGRRLGPLKHHKSNNQNIHLG